MKVKRICRNCRYFHNYDGCPSCQLGRTVRPCDRWSDGDGRRPVEMDGKALLSPLPHLYLSSDLYDFLNWDELVEWDGSYPESFMLETHRRSETVTLNPAGGTVRLEWEYARDGSYRFKGLRLLIWGRLSATSWVRTDPSDAHSGNRWHVWQTFGFLPERAGTSDSLDDVKRDIYHVIVEHLNIGGDAPHSREVF